MKFLKAEMKIVVCDNSEKALKLMAHKAPHLKTIVIMDNIITSEAIELSKQLDIQLIQFNAAKEKGAANQKPVNVQMN